MKRPKVVIPFSCLEMIFQYYHSSPMGANLGFKKMYNKIKNVFIYTKMRRDMDSICKLSFLRAVKARLNRKERWVNIWRSPNGKTLCRFLGSALQIIMRRRQMCIFGFRCIFQIFWAITTKNTTSETVILCLKNCIFARHGLCKISLRQWPWV